MKYEVPGYGDLTIMNVDLIRGNKVKFVNKDIKDVPIIPKGVCFSSKKEKNRYMADRLMFLANEMMDQFVAYCQKDEVGMSKRELVYHQKCKYYLENMELFRDPTNFENPKFRKVLVGGSSCIDVDDVDYYSQNDLKDIKYLIKEIKRKEVLQASADDYVYGRSRKK